ncbi:MAG: M67 family metallopeptidase [Candidatus Omnitrophica bacterium]|nr:M67 family metallopeptidase [Candidatus Omnitrophota bacterium]
MRIINKVIREIIDHAKKESPLEACGYLGAKDGIIIKKFTLTNIDKSSEHFSFDPKEQFIAVKDARAQGLDLCAVYHSHPSSLARPSQEDIKLAYDPAMNYFIVSLLGVKEDVRVFSIKNGEVNEISLEAVDDKRV